MWKEKEILLYMFSIVCCLQCCRFLCLCSIIGLYTFRFLLRMLSKCSTLGFLQTSNHSATSSTSLSHQWETREPRLKSDAIMRSQRQKSGCASLTMNWWLMDSKCVCLTFFRIALVTESVLKFSPSFSANGAAPGLSLYWQLESLTSHF